MDPSSLGLAKIKQALKRRVRSKVLLQFLKAHQRPKVAYQDQTQAMGMPERPCHMLCRESLTSLLIFGDFVSGVCVFLRHPLDF